MQKYLLAITSLLFCLSAHAGGPTPCAEKIEAAVSGDLSDRDPNGDGWTSHAKLLLETWEDSGLPEDKNLQLWKVTLVSKPGQGLPTFNVYAITRGEGISACTLVKIIGGK